MLNVPVNEAAQAVIAHDLAQAAFSTGVAHTRLCYAYRNAVANFHHKEGEADPITIKLAVQAAAYGVLSMCTWLRECEKAGYITRKGLADSLEDIMWERMKAASITLDDVPTP